MDVADHVEIPEVCVHEPSRAGRVADGGGHRPIDLLECVRRKVGTICTEGGASEPGIPEVRAHDVGDLDAIGREELEEARHRLDFTRREAIDRGGATGRLERPPEWIERGRACRVGDLEAVPDDSVLRARGSHGEAGQAGGRGAGKSGGDHAGRHRREGRRMLGVLTNQFRAQAVDEHEHGVPGWFQVQRVGTVCAQCRGDGRHDIGQRVIRGGARDRDHAPTLPHRHGAGCRKSRSGYCLRATAHAALNRYVPSVERRNVG